MSDDLKLFSLTCTWGANQLRRVIVVFAKDREDAWKLMLRQHREDVSCESIDDVKEHRPKRGLVLHREP